MIHNMSQNLLQNEAHILSFLEWVDIFAWYTAATVKGKMYLCRGRLKKLGVLMNALADQKHEAEQNFHGGAPAL